MPDADRAVEDKTSAGLKEFIIINNKSSWPKNQSKPDKEKGKPWLQDTRKSVQL
jgi:hypothetical protein